MTDKEMLLYNSLHGLHLLSKADTHTVVSDLMGLQAQFANYPKASLLIRASDYRFIDKKKYYVGFENSRKQKEEGTKIKELLDLATSTTDFTETDIVQRNARILFGFVEYMNDNCLLSEE